MGEILVCCMLRCRSKLAPGERLGATGTGHGWARSGPAVSERQFVFQWEGGVFSGGTMFYQVRTSCEQLMTCVWAPLLSMLKCFRFLLSISVLMEVVKKLCTCQQRASENMI